MQRLTFDVLQDIFVFLTCAELLDTRRVCRRWKDETANTVAIFNDFCGDEYACGREGLLQRLQTDGSARDRLPTPDYRRASSTSLTLFWSRFALRTAVTHFAHAITGLQLDPLGDTLIIECLERCAALEHVRMSRVGNTILCVQPLVTAPYAAQLKSLVIEDSPALACDMLEKVLTSCTSLACISLGALSQVELPTFRRVLDLAAPTLSSLTVLGGACLATEHLVLLARLRCLVSLTLHARAIVPRSEGSTSGMRSFAQRTQATPPLDGLGELHAAPALRQLCLVGFMRLSTDDCAELGRLSQLEGFTFRECGWADRTAAAAALSAPAASLRRVIFMGTPVVECRDGVQVATFGGSN